MCGGSPAFCDYTDRPIPANERLSQTHLTYLRSINGLAEKQKLINSIGKKRRHVLVGGVASNKNRNRAYFNVVSMRERWKCAIQSMIIE